ncbi:MAG TPA: hypothetical protein VFA81_01390, partial [Burkholderiales bacterium]|nr:hypothetical protein [Burkholderiales bacterium]
IADHALEPAQFPVSATASSGLLVSFVSETTAVCAVTTNTVTAKAIGTCTIRAEQAGNANYAAAAPVHQSFEVVLGLSVQPSASTFNVDGDEFSLSGTVQAPLNSSLFVGDTEAVIDASGRSLTTFR